MIYNGYILEKGLFLFSKYWRNDKVKTTTISAANKVATKVFHRVINRVASIFLAIALLGGLCGHSGAPVPVPAFAAQTADMCVLQYRHCGGGLACQRYEHRDACFL